VAIGGAIIERSYSQLIPAWNPALETDVLNDESLAWSDDSTYGPVGKEYFVGFEPWAYSVIPFSPTPKRLSLNESYDGSGSKRVGSYSDSPPIWEHRPSIDSDPANDAGWFPNVSPVEWVKYNDEMSSTGYNDLLGRASVGLRTLSYAKVKFDHSQIDYKTETSGDVVTTTKSFKTMYVEVQRVIGTNSYDTGHRGKFPRPRWRYIANPDWIKVTSTIKTDDPTNRIGFEKIAGGLNSLTSSSPTSPSSGYVDRTGTMVDRAETSVEQTSRPKNSSTFDLSGFDLSFKIGSTVKRILDSSGAVVRDQLDWIVKSREYNRAMDITTVIMDNARRF